MLRFYYNPAYKYTNRMIIEVSQDTSFVIKDVVNIDSADTINAHIIYDLTQGEQIPTYIIDDDNNRRYFVSGIRQLRSGKFQLSLIRDIVSESSDWLNESAYISAGTATDYNKYKIWNLPFTNTKVGEQRLNINGKSSFFVFYVNTVKNENGVLTEQDLKISGAALPNITGFDKEVNNLNEIPHFNYVGNTVNTYTTEFAYVTFLALREGTTKTGQYNAQLNDTGLTIKEINLTANDCLSLLPTKVYNLKKNENNSLNQFNDVISNYVYNYYKGFENFVSRASIKELDEYVNKIIKNKADNKVYKITKSVVTKSKKVESSPTELLGAIRGINFPASGTISYIQDGNWFTHLYTNNQVTYTLEELGEATSYEFNFTSKVRKLPKSSVRCVNIVSDDVNSDTTISQVLSLLQTNPTNTTDTGRIIDIQYLPFSIATTPDDNLSISGKKLIGQFLDTDDYEYLTNLPDLKNINKETDSIKIVSPSRCSQFLFKPYNNNGNMEFDTKITLRPNASIIYVRPSTKGLLMNDWNDKDCLIIQEDFSLTKVTSEWTNYVYNNRNYQNAFNRDIQGREFSREWQRKVEQAQKRADEWTGRNISASKARTYTGNLPILSGVAGAIGTAFKDEVYMQMAQLDREMNESLYQESIDIAKDMFDYQLENMQSQPLVPTSITTIDVKMLDGIYLEFYSTNQTEKEAINNFYKYNGNRIDSYGKFINYLGHFVRGKIIISENYTQPELNELNRRLELGIFTGKEE